jgi:hypothetical protein
MQIPVKFVSKLWQIFGFLPVQISSTNRINLYDIAELLLIVVDHMFVKFEDKKGVIRSRKLKMDREYNG